jgi:predicted secreted protein
MPPTPIPATATPSATAPSVQTVTLDENGGTITLKIGERFLLELGENYDWTVTVADQTILSRVVNVTVVRGAQGLYEAHKPGTTKLTAVGDPFCRKAQPPCAAPSLLFEIEVIVK